MELTNPSSFNNLFSSDSNEDKFLTKKNVISLLIIAILILIVPVTVKVIKEQKQIFKSRAVGEVIDFPTQDNVIDIKGEKVALKKDIKVQLNSPFGEPAGPTAVPCVVPPTGLAVNNGQAVTACSVTLSWGAVSGAQSYYVRLDDGNKTNGKITSSAANNCGDTADKLDICINKYSSTSITISNLSPKTNYNWWVHSYSNANPGCLLSNFTSAQFTTPDTCAAPSPTVADTTPPKSTIDITVTGDKQIKVTFNATDTGGSGVRVIHTAYAEGANAKNEALNNTDKWKNSYKGLQPGESRIFTSPVYFEYLAEDNSKNLEATNKKEL